MISLNQIQILEQKIESVLQLVSKLQNEKAICESRNAELEAELEKLTVKCRRFEQDETEIEQGILSMLNRLNNIEDTVQNMLVQTPQNEQAGGGSKVTAQEVASKPADEQLDIF